MFPKKKNARFPHEKTGYFRFKSAGGEHIDEYGNIIERYLDNGKENPHFHILTHISDSSI